MKFCQRRMNLLLKTDIFCTKRCLGTVSNNSPTTPFSLLVIRNGRQEVHARTLTSVCKSGIVFKSAHKSLSAQATGTCHQHIGPQWLWLTVSDRWICTIFESHSAPFCHFLRRVFLSCKCFSVTVHRPTYSHAAARPVWAAAGDVLLVGSVESTYSANTSQ